MNLKEIIFEPGLVCFYFEKIGLFTFRQQYFSDLTAMKEFMLQVKEFLPEEKKPLFTEEKTVY